MDELERELADVPSWSYAEFENAQQGTAPDASKGAGDL